MNKTVGIDPWTIEAERTRNAPGFRRPDLGPVSVPALFALGLAAAVRAAGLVLIAEAVARGIAGLTAGTLDGGLLRLVLVIGLVGAVARGGAEWATQVLSRRIATRVKRDLRSRLWRRIAEGDARSGQVAVLAADGLDDLDAYYVQSLPSMIASGVVPLLVGVRILGADWVSALVIVLCVPLIPVFMILIGKHTQQRTDEATNALARLADHLSELARGLPVLVGLGRVDEQTRALDAVQKQYRERTQETLRWAFLSALALELISTISVAVVAVFLGIRLLNHTMTLEPAIVALVLAPECFAALREVGTAFHASQDGLSALERAKALLSRPRVADVRRSRDADGADGAVSRSANRQNAGSSPAAGQSPAAAPSTGQGSRAQAPTVRVQDVSVRYAGRGAATLNGLSAVLTGVVAVTGPSGCGKSTLLAALTGTLPADAEIAGIIAGIRPERVGYAPQAPHGFAATPRAELALYGAADPASALAELGLERLADAAVSELSPGEQRRLAVARALARVDAGATLLVLDEPTAHLDAASAAGVRAAIRARAATATIVLASHEPETLAIATTTVAVAPGLPGPAAAIDASERTAESETSPARPARQQAPAAASPHPWRLLASVLRPHRWAWTAAVALGVLATGLGLALTAVSGWLIVRASVEEYIMYLLVAIVGVRAFGIGRSAGRYVERLITHRAAFAVIDDLRLRLWRAIAARGAGSRRLLEGGAPVDYLVTLADDLRDQLPRVIPPIAVGVLTIVGTGVTAAFVTPHLAVGVTVSLLIATALASALAILSERGAGRARVASRSRIVRGTAALAQSADDLRGNGVDGAALTDLDAASDGLATAERRAAWSAGLGSALITVTTAVLAVAVPLLSPDVPGELAAVVSLLSLALTEPLVALVTAVHRVPAVRAVLTRLDAVLQPAPTPAWGDAQPAAPVRRLLLDDVSVRYPGAADPVFSGVSGRAGTGRWLVVDGPSGSGKSTLLSAVMGALPVSGGAIVADDAPLTSLDGDAWRDRVAWCPQDAYVFDSTLRGNLLLARPRTDAPSDDLLHAVLAEAGLEQLLSTLPLGLATEVGQGGSALSGGERQRLAVARALLTRADVILLDEPTAHLDEPTAASMMSDVRCAAADRAVLLVSHRRADRSPDDSVIRLG